jgi:hypothetical protein
MAAGSGVVHTFGMGDTLRDLPQLELEERAVSRRRRQLHERIDFLRGSGASDPESTERLEKLAAEEHEVSVRRKELHRRIDALRAQAPEGSNVAEKGPPRKDSLLDMRDSSYARSLQIGFGSLTKREDEEE